jgi:hypothetical protein
MVTRFGLGLPPVPEGQPRETMSSTVIKAYAVLYRERLKNIRSFT